jgi:hypothetical protein
LPFWLGVQYEPELPTRYSGSPDQDYRVDYTLILQIHRKPWHRLAIRQPGKKYSEFSIVNFFSRSTDIATVTIFANFITVADPPVYYIFSHPCR